MVTANAWKSGNGKVVSDHGVLAMVAAIHETLETINNGNHGNGDFWKSGDRKQWLPW